MDRGWAENAEHGAGGRRRYNRERQDKALERQLKLVHLLEQHGWRYGNGIKFAKELGVSPATISRDTRAIFSRPGGPVWCPFCGAVNEPDGGETL
jgi:hypothetical protein